MVDDNDYDNDKYNRNNDNDNNGDISNEDDGVGLQLRSLKGHPVDFPRLILFVPNI